MKKEVCGSCEQCTRPTERALALLKRVSPKKNRKKKKGKTQTQDGAFLHYPNAQLLCPFIIIWKENDVFSSENS